MSFVQRLFAIAAGAMSAAYGALLLAAAAGWVPTDLQIRPLEFLLGAWRLQLWGAGLASLAVGLAAVVGFGARERHKGPVVTESELGRIAISRRAVERLVERAARQASGVREVRVDLHQGEGGFTVSLVLEVAADVSLPDVSHEVQEGVERYLRETAGLTARQVNVEIRQVAGDEPRKESMRA